MWHCGMTTDFVASAGFAATLARVVAAIGPERVVVFGSYARGTQIPTSDLDLLVVAAVEGESRQRRQQLRRLLAWNLPRVDVVLCTPSELDERLATGDSFLAGALASGITVYSKGQHEGGRREARTPMIAHWLGNP